MALQTKQRKVIELSATAPITTPIDVGPYWKGFNGHLVVLGLAFLEGCRVTIDVDDERLWVEDLQTVSDAFEKQQQRDSIRDGGGGDGGEGGQQQPYTKQYFIPKARVFDGLNGVA